MGKQSPTPTRGECPLCVERRHDYAAVVIAYVEQIKRDGSRRRKGVHEGAHICDEHIAGGLSLDLVRDVPGDLVRYVACYLLRDVACYLLRDVAGDLVRDISGDFIRHFARYLFADVLAPHLG